jgi:hypothetical protein
MGYWKKRCSKREPCIERSDLLGLIRREMLCNMTYNIEYHLMYRNDNNSKPEVPLRMTSAFVTPTHLLIRGSRKSVLEVTFCTRVEDNFLSAQRIDQFSHWCPSRRSSHLVLPFRAFPPDCTPPLLRYHQKRKVGHLCNAQHVQHKGRARGTLTHPNQSELHAPEYPTPRFCDSDRPRRRTEFLLSTQTDRAWVYIKLSNRRANQGAGE